MKVEIIMNSGKIHKIENSELDFFSFINDFMSKPLCVYNNEESMINTKYVESIDEIFE